MSASHLFLWWISNPICAVWGAARVTGGGLSSLLFYKLSNKYQYLVTNWPLFYAVGLWDEWLVLIFRLQTSRDRLQMSRVIELVNTLLNKEPHRKCVSASSLTGEPVLTKILALWSPECTAASPMLPSKPSLPISSAVKCGVVRSLMHKVWVVTKASSVPTAPLATWPQSLQVTGGGEWLAVQKISSHQFSHFSFPLEFQSLVSGLSHLPHPVMQNWPSGCGDICTT